MSMQWVVSRNALRSGTASVASGDNAAVVLVAVTDHAVERFRQRVAGALDARTEIASRVAKAVAAGRISDEPPPGATGARGSVYVRDSVDRSLVYICRRDRDELVVVTLWEQEGGVVPPRVPRAYTDELERHERRRGGQR
jgi:hypothetical protein